MYRPEEIVAKRRQVDALVSQGRAWPMGFAGQHALSLQIENGAAQSRWLCLKGRK